MTKPRWGEPTGSDYSAEAPVDLDTLGRRNAPTLLVPELTDVRPVEPSRAAAADWTYLPDRPRPELKRPSPAEWGWRARIRRLTGGRLRIGPGPAEMDFRDAEETITLATFPASRLVMIANEKGGAGKTPASLIIAGIIAELRHAPVVAWDVNEMRGSLALRAETESTTRTIVDMLQVAERLGSASSPVADLESFLRRQPEGHLVLASTTDGNAMRQLTDEDCGTVRRLLHHRYPLVIADTGNNAASQPWGSTIDNADVLVIPARPVDAHLDPAMKLLALAASRDRTRHLAQNAVLIITSADGARLTGEHEQWFINKGVTVLHVPGDAVIDASARMPLAALSVASRRAWTHAAAAVMRAAAHPSPRDLERNK